LTCFGGIFDNQSSKDRLVEIETLTIADGFWDDANAAKILLREQSTLKKRAEEWETVERKVDDINALIELAKEAGDEELDLEAESEIEGLSGYLQGIELRRMLSGPNDEMDAVININAGAGGTDSQDWADMLARMYQRWADRHGFKTELIDRQTGDEAGIKAMTMSIHGDHVYGYLKAEIGVHRLVRISPFDSNARRHTSFSSVTVYPDVDDSIEVDINDEDLRIDVYRAGGAGGQHVNKTESAVRITHMPTGIVVQCQNERSQHKNKASAMRVLRGRIYELECRKRDEEKEKSAEKKSIEWGSQIRSYVMAPYRLVTDHRIDLKVGNVDAVLDGDIDTFIESYLIQTNKSTVVGRRRSLYERRASLPLLQVNIRPRSRRQDLSKSSMALPIQKMDRHCLLKPM